MAQSIVEQMARDMNIWSEQQKRDVDQIAKEVQSQMRQRVKDNTPTGPGKDGHLKSGWTKKDFVLRQRAGAKIYGVRSRNKPMIVHLVNFPHRIVVHGHDTGRKTQGDPFVDQAEAWGQAELDRRLDAYFGH